MSPGNRKTTPFDKDDLMLVPAIDISPLYDEPRFEDTSLPQDLVDSLARHGAVRLTGHGVPACKVRRAFELVSCTCAMNLFTPVFFAHTVPGRESKEFFDLPPKHKASAAVSPCPESGPSRGYRQVTSDAQKRTVVESFVAGPPCETHHPTRWPIGVRGEVLKMTLHALFRHCVRLHHDLLDILEVALNLRHDELAGQWVQQNGEVQLGHSLHPGQYPHVTNGEGGLFTLVFSWTASGEIVLFCGQTLRKWTMAWLGLRGDKDKHDVGLSPEEHCHFLRSSSYSLAFVSYADEHTFGSGCKVA